MPCGAQLSSLALDPNQTVRVSADEFNICFYNVGGPEDVGGYGAVGRPWLGTHFNAAERQHGPIDEKYTLPVC